MCWGELNQSCSKLESPAAAGSHLSSLAAERESQFDERFSLTFPVNNIPPGINASSVVETSKAALSNLLGSMGYFVGASKVGGRPVHHWDT